MTHPPVNFFKINPNHQKDQPDQFDVAIVGIDTNSGFSLSELVKPVEMPFEAGPLGQVTTFASSANLQLGEIESARIQILAPPPGSILAGAPGVSICRGDSGTGLITTVGGRNFLTGVASGTSLVDNCSAPGADVKVAPISQSLDWLKTVTANSLYPIKDPPPLARIDLFSRKYSTTSDLLVTQLGANGTISANVALPPVTNGWVLYGSAQFNLYARIIFNPVTYLSHTIPGDRITDLFWLKPNGIVEVWLVQSDGSVNDVVDVAQPIPAGYRIDAVADEDGDGIGDLILRNTTDNTVQSWILNLDGTLRKTVTINTPGPGQLGPGWKIASTGDFNLDKRADLVWTNSSTGGLQIWKMFDGMVVSTVSFANQSTQSVLQGTGDFDRDGVDELVWLNAGQISISTVVDAGGVGSLSPHALGTAPAALRIGDVTGDGVADLVFRNASAGTVTIWPMNKNFTHGTSVTSTLAAAWSVQAVGTFH